MMPLLLMLRTFEYRRDHWRYFHSLHTPAAPAAVYFIDCLRHQRAPLLCHASALQMLRSALPPQLLPPRVCYRAMRAAEERAAHTHA